MWAVNIDIEPCLHNNRSSTGQNDQLFLDFKRNYLHPCADDEIKIIERKPEEGFDLSVQFFPWGSVFVVSSEVLLYSLYEPAFDR